MLEIEGTYVDRTPKDQYKVHQKGAGCVPKEGRAGVMEVDIDVACSTTHQYARKTPSTLAERRAGHSCTHY